MSSLRSRLAGSFSSQGGRIVSQTPRSTAGHETGVSQFYRDRKAREAAQPLVQAQKKTNRSAEQQYQDLLKNIRSQQQVLMGSGGIFDSALGQLAQSGADAKAGVQDNRLRQIAQANQSLLSRGLGNTTIAPTVTRGINADAARSIRAIDESVNRQKSGVRLSQAGAQLQLANLESGGILSRQIQGPDVNSYLSLLQNLAQFGG